MYYQLVSVYVLTNFNMKQYFYYKGQTFDNGVFHTAM
jgi:hypothetical protein